MSLAHRSPIVNTIVFNLIREVHFEKFKFSKKETIDQSIITPISETILSMRGFQESSYPRVFVPQMSLPAFQSPRKEGQQVEKAKQPEVVPVKIDSAPPGFQESIIEREKILLPKPAVLPIQPLPRMPQAPRPAPRKAPLVPINLFQNPPNYGKLNMVVRDPFIQFIECPGPDQRLIVTRNGQKQQTNVVLTSEEIKMLLQNVSAKTKIPLLNGVFRVSWDNMVINAVISDNLDSRFLIKKG